MERIRQIWIESARSSSTIESCGGTGAVHGDTAYCSSQFHVNSRPPPLRTSSTYDDDDAFNNVALNLLSRHEILGLSATEAILATLVTAKQRASFYEGLLIRLEHGRLSHLSPHTASLVQSLERTFGASLAALMAQSDGSDSYHNTKPPTSPRHFHSTLNMVPMGTCRSQGRKKSTRRFFPEGSMGDKSHTTAPTLGLFGNKRRVRNIDWTVAEAIQQVNRLQLDSDSPVNATRSPDGPGGYEAPHRF